MNPIIANLHNVKDNKFHPILFLAHPLFGNSGDFESIRYKSKLHHTDGFVDRDQSLDFCSTTMLDYTRRNFGEPCFCISKDFVWDGCELPAMVVFFLNNGEGFVPVL
jgi:hypothetical protein